MSNNSAKTRIGLFKKILIANRGEIACRVIKTAHRLGVKTVAVYSDADKNSLHVKLADEAIYIGASPSSESYLVGERIIEAALKTGAQAIHPGYGFLSENAEFAQSCDVKGIVFIGPPTSAIQAMGSKSAAKEIMEKAQVPLVPGYHGKDQDPKIIKASADEMGYPVLLKAVAGGGGKGMRQVWSAEEFDQALAAAKSESLASFGDDQMLVEKYLTQPRHVEVQVFCDSLGDGVYLFERDCSVQRRHQKVIEEAPAPNISESQRQQMGETAVKAAQAIDYVGAGTVEFLFDEDGSFYFMEMNTRLQVEHPVTEMITGEDLVEWQLRVAAGEPLPKSQDQLSITGHSFEARVYAEDPNNEFLPTTGTLHTLNTPIENENVRVDTGVVKGDEVSPFYDPMIAKLIVWGEDRKTALTRLMLALQSYQIAGVTTNLNFLYDLASSEPFTNAELDTGFIEKHHDLLFNKNDQDWELAIAQAALYLLLDSKRTKSNNDPWFENNGWRLNQASRHRFDLVFDGNAHPIKLIEEKGSYQIILSGATKTASASLEGLNLIATIDGHRQKATVAQSLNNYILFNDHGRFEFTEAQLDTGDDDASKSDQHYSAPMNGTIVEILINAGDEVAEGDVLLVMEAMKMQHTITAHSDGIVSQVFFNAGDLVDGGAALIDFESTD